MLSDTVQGSMYDAIYVCSEPILETIQPLIDDSRAWRAFPVSPREALTVVFNKHAVVARAASHNVPVPTTIVPQSEDDVLRLGRELPYPIVVKGEKGEAAQTVRLVRERADLLAAFRHVRKLEAPYGGQPALQEFIPGETYLVGAVVDRGTTLRVAAHRKDLMYPAGGGSTVRGVTEHHPALITSALATFAALRYTGIGSLDFIRDPRDGQFKLLEINPRPWATLGLSLRSTDLLTAYGALAQGKPVEPDLRYRTGVVYHRLTGELRLIAEQPARLFGFLKDCLDPRVASDLDLLDFGAHMPAIRRVRRRVTDTYVGVQDIVDLDDEATELS
jgi:predicted ATP-grasp superfamily ATP-dependent carboligase